MSFDPRVNRLAEESKQATFHQAEPMDQWQTFEVFHQKSRGDHHIHVGIVHAPNPEMALLYAKEQYARRMKCVNLWVVKSSDITATHYDDEDIFQPATDKSYREAFGYKVGEIIKNFKKKENITGGRKSFLKEKK